MISFLFSISFLFPSFSQITQVASRWLGGIDVQHPCGDYTEIWSTRHCPSATDGSTYRGINSMIFFKNKQIELTMAASWSKCVCVFFFLHFCGPCLPLAWKCLNIYCHIVMFSRQKDLCFRWLQWLLAAKRVRRMFPWDVRMLQETVVISLVERCWDRRFGGSICFMFGIAWFTLDSETPENQSVLLHQKPAQLAYLQTYTRIYLCVVLLILVVWLCV